MRSAQTFTLLAAALLLAACTEANTDPRMAAKPFSDFDVLTAEQSACLFDCPFFTLEIFADGRVRHSGPDFETTGGVHEARIDRSGLEHIAKALSDARIDEMRDRYAEGDDICDNSVTDMSILSFSVRRGQGKRNKSVELYTGCIGGAIPSDRINALIKAIEQVTGTEALLKQRSKVRAPHPGGVAPLP